MNPLSLTSHAAMVLGLALALAWAWDVILGDLPEALHPMAWISRLLWPLGCRVRVLPPQVAYWSGALVWLALAGAIGWGAWALQAWLLALPFWASAAVLAVALKPAFSWAGLHDDIAAVEEALIDDLPGARARLSALVTRDITEAGEEDLRQVAIETLAERLNENVIAPLVWFALAGVPGALVCRFASTIAAMWGYRGVWEWAGKWSAHAGNVIGWLPSRITALALFPTWRANTWRALRRQAGRTPSRNTGWAIGAMALRLGVRLSKPGVYVLNETGASPSSRNMAAALRHAGAAAWAIWTLAGLACIVRWL